MASDDVVMGGVKMPREAARMAEWVGVDAAADLERVRSGAVTQEQLLAECLEGAEAEHEGDWREYVASVVAAAGPLQYGLEPDGTVTSVRDDVAVVDGHRTLYSYDGRRWASHVYGPGGAEGVVDEGDVPAAVRAAIEVA